ncbi:MAG: PAS domain S-box protein [Bacteroidota bacterium]
MAKDKGESFSKNNDYKGIEENSKSSQQKYIQNQERLRKILDLVPHMIFLKDYDGEILMANKACADFYNIDTKELVYSNISEQHSQKDELERILLEDRKVIDYKEKIELDDIILTNSQGNKKNYKTTKIPFTDPITNETGSLGISIDITEQKKAEKAKNEAKEKYRLLVERGNDGIIILQNENIIFSNNQAARIFGADPKNFLNKNITNYIGQREFRAITASYLLSRKNKEIDPLHESRFFKPNGDVCYIEMKISTIGLNTEKSRLVFIRDITKRKLAEQLRERDKNMLEQAQKISKLGSWELNMENKQIYCSEEIYRILEVNDDYKPAKVNWFMQFIPKEEKSAIFRAFLKAYRTGNRCEHEFPIISAKGNRKILHAQSQVFKDDNNGSISIIGTWLDITERIRIEQMLKVAKAKAEESDKLKSAFLANMSHEIRTPMNSILGFANLLKTPDIEDEAKLEYLDHIIQSGDNLLNLINDIIDISKIEAEQLKVEKIPVNINELLDQLYNRYEELITINHPGEIELYLEKAIPGKGISIDTDPYRLQQVISNLLNNSIKFTKEGKIVFGYRIQNGNLKFFVNDDGVGIPADKHSFIFKRFGKLEDPGKINMSGTGLGLSISKSLIEILGGTLWLNTEYTSGAEFFFNIPLKESKLDNPEQQAKAPNEIEQSIDLKGNIILIAEDEILNYKLLETLIKKTGAEVKWAKNGLQAVETIRQRNDINLVFMDIKMPKMNGYEATRKIKKLKPKIPVIAQTAFAFANEKASILESGCDHYLKKPIQKNEIYKVLNRYLKK